MHVVVIGAGVFGTWTAHHLLNSGATVTLVDAYGPGNSRSSSGDETRIVRCGYGPDRIYSDFALRSLSQWRELDEHLREHQAPIWHRCGVLWMAPLDDPYFVATIDTMRSGPYNVELLTDGALRDRYPDLRVPEGVSALLEPDCGIVMARRSVQALSANVERRGVRLLRGRVTEPSRHSTMRAVRLSDGTEIAGDGFIFACGAWLGRLFPGLLGERIRPTRQVVVYFGTPAGDDRFSARRMPAWITRTGIYGTPDAEGRGLKVGLDEHGPPMDPDSDDRLADEKSVVAARAWLKQHIPALSEAPIVESRVCQYENTDTGDFLIDRHPDHDNVWIAGGGSGHGFKHGPAVGELAARLATAGAATEPRFSIAGKTTAARRAIY
jgi:sarcosine oxidase